MGRAFTLSGLVEATPSEADGYSLGAGVAGSGGKVDLAFDVAWVHTEAEERLRIVDAETADGHRIGADGALDLSADRIVASVIARF